MAGKLSGFAQQTAFGADAGLPGQTIQGASGGRTMTLPSATRSPILLSSYPTHEPVPMASGERLTTRLSTKGQLILPKSIRQRRQWQAGMRLMVEDRAEGVLLTAAPAFDRTRPERVFGSLKTNGPAKTLDEMKLGVLAEARRRHARD
jgi:AbrB family looped-hinge helix DNA binding protein